MEFVKLGKKGQLSIPRSLLRKVGISTETPVLIGATDDGAIIIRPAAVYPVEVYSEERVAEFVAAVAPGSEREKRLRRALCAAK
ncbi:MAG: AbrB/MazE/SpoVT family DNA-binding domain-containing protein [Deltaproteobacteria bacterium]|nr:AbrB/MazE/SpoVT family DNA-binding domain-containing protein [Deltaproteobacteria bacterium]